MHETPSHGLAGILLRPPRPDPWPAELDTAVRAREAVPLCVHCLSPQEGYRWFCAECGRTVGDWVPLLPYAQIFLLGEMLRAGVSGLPERRMGVQVFLVMFSITQYGLFAPVYWFWMLRQAQGHPICKKSGARIEPEAPA